MRWHARRDANETAIVEALNAIGVWVERVSSAGFPDLACWRPGDDRVRLVEVKTKRGRPTKAQQASAVPREVVRTVDEALALFVIPSPANPTFCGAPIVERDSVVDSLP